MVDHRGMSAIPAPSEQAELTEQLVDTIRRFVEREVIPVASKYEHANEYPTDLVERMKELGLFGATIAPEWGGLGLDYSTYARIVEEICRGWMSLSGVLNTHLMFAYVLQRFGTPAQQERWLPAMARGEHRAALCLTEPHAGSDTQQIRTTARRDGDDYVVNGSKMFITNARTATIYSLLAKTDPTATPPHKGMTLFAAERGPGITVGRDIDKIGYKGIETCEVNFEDYRVPASNLVGGEEGHGLQMVLSGLEVGRINIAARAVGVARRSATPRSAPRSASRSASIRPSS
jgi:alkylation response protein AidB-like acyl-CoA dehydrogenase